MERLTYKDSTLPRATEHGELIRAYSDYNPRTIINKLSEYEDLEEQGRLVVLPCKVGDTVYVFYTGRRNCKWPCNMKKSKIYEVTVSGMRLHDWSDDWSALLFFDAKEMTGDYEFSFDEFGKTVFLTREDAEKALEGVSDDA